MIKKLDYHYSMGVRQSVMDNEELTALELASRTANKMNEVVEIANTIEQSAIESRAVVDEMVVQQTQFIDENNATRNQFILDNQALIDELDASNTTFQNDVNTSKTTFETTMNGSITAFQNELNTSKTNFENSLNSAKTTFETNMTNDLTTFQNGLNSSKTTFETNMNNNVNDIVTNANNTIQTDVNNKINGMVSDGTIEGLINDNILGDVKNEIIDNELSFSEVMGSGVVSGLSVEPQAVSDMTVNVNLGVAHLYNGKRYTQDTIQSIVILPHDALYPRIDIIYINSLGVLSYEKGVANSNPIAPSPLNSLILAEISVLETTTSITEQNINDVRTIKQDFPSFMNDVNSHLGDNAINVKTFGAKGDGITDDTIAIQNAINSLSTYGGGKILFPKGNYKITSPITISKYFIVLVGNGRESSIYNVGTTSSLIFQNCEQVSIMDMSIKGNGGASGVGATNLHGVEFINVHHVKMYNVTILYNGGHGVYLHGGAWCHYYTSCYITQNALDGINSVSPSGASSDQNGNNLSIVNCSLLQNGGNGLKWKASGLNVMGCDIEINKQSGLLIDTTGSTLSAYGININGNYFEGNYQGQIKFVTIVGYIITGVNISGNYLISSHVGGATALIIASGVADSLDYMVITKGNSFNISGATVINFVDLGGTPRTSCVVWVDNTTKFLNLGRAEIKLPLKTKFVSALFHQKGFPCTDPNKTDNVFGLEPRTGLFEIPLNEGDYLYKLRLFIETDATSDYIVTFTLKNADLSGANALATVTSSPITVSGGGNKNVEWAVFGSLAYRHAKNKNLYLQVNISTPVTGTYMYLYDMVVEYI